MFTLKIILRYPGGGINANLGLIYRPIDQLTVGVSYQTPTIFLSKITGKIFVLESSVLGIQSGDSLFDSNSQSEAPLFEYNMTLKTPSRLSAGATYFFQKYGFVTANVDYLNYSNSRFSSSDFII